MVGIAKEIIIAKFFKGENVFKMNILVKDYIILKILDRLASVLNRYANADDPGTADKKIG